MAFEKKNRRSFFDDPAISCVVDNKDNFTTSSIRRKISLKTVERVGGPSDQHEMLAQEVGANY